MSIENNIELKPAPLKDRMTVYLGALVVISVSWLYILGMGWHMNTLPFVDNPAVMNMDMDMDQKSMEMGMPMNPNMSLVDKILSWMPPASGAWELIDFMLLFLMWSVMMIAMMTPSILPMLLVFTTLNSRNKANGKDNC